MRLIQSVRRWLRHPAQRAFEMKSMPTFWKARRAFEKGQHFVLTRRLYAGEAARNVRESSQILTELTRQIIGSVLLAVIVFGGLLFVDWFLEHAGMELIARYQPAFGAVLTQAKQTAASNSESIRSLLNTVAQLTGLFLTLYFTAISLIASTVYARVPGDVRALAVNEKVGNIYIRVVALLGAISILYLLAAIVGVRVGLAGITVVGALSIAALFSFLFLGKRTFNFFQPAILVQYILNDFTRWVSLATRRRSRQTRSLQDYYRRRAEKSIRTYRNIVSLAAKEEFHRIEADALVTILRGVIDAAVFYGNRKSAIPGDSFWFERINKHANWLTVGHVQLDMALRTGRPIDPEQVPNFLWVEERLEGILHEASNVLAKRDEPTPWLQFANTLYYRLEKLAYLFVVEEALLLFRSQRREIISVVESCRLRPAAELSDEANRKLSFHVGALAFLLSYFMSISIGFARRAEELSREFIEQLSADLLRDDPLLIYSSHLPRTVLAECESLAMSVHAEKFVERQLVTPPWYVCQILARSFIEYLKDTSSLLVAEAEQTLHAALETYKPVEKYLFLAQVISSGIEICDKLHAHFLRVEQATKILNEFRRVTDIPWTEVDWKALHERIDALHRKLMLAAAGILLPLDSLPTARYWPDYFGQMYSFVTRETYLAMERGDTELFQRLFPASFAASIAANTRLQRELKEKDARVTLAWSTTPINDIVELSGYAQLFSDLDGKDFYAVVVKTWEAYLKSVKDPIVVLKFIATVLDFRVRDFVTAARDIERTNWQLSFERLLRSRGLRVDDWEYDRRPQATHASKLIREFTRGPRGFVHASDVFVVIFVMPRLAGEKVEFPHTAQNLADALARDDDIEPESYTA
jgi:hypothetical protein